MQRWSAMLLLLVPLTWSLPVSAGPDAEELGTALTLLKEKSFERKTEGIDRIVQGGDPRAGEFLRALLEGRLYYRKQDKTLVFAERRGREYAITAALSGEDLGTVKKRKIKKITVNNQMRSRIRTALASLDLTHPDAAARLTAVREMLGSPDPDTIEAIRLRLDAEEDAGVRQIMAEAVALGALESDVADIRLDAVMGLTQSLEPAVRNRLTRIAEDDPDERVKAAAAHALKEFEARAQLYGLVETLFFGLSLGSVLVLAAIGLAITFGVMGVINMAHGELIMLGAYTTYVIQQALPSYIDLSLFVAIPAAFVISGLVGILIERGVIRFLYGRPLETLLATFGISLVLQQAVRSIFSPLNRSVETPTWMAGSLEINSLLSLTLNRLYIILFCLLVFTALFMVLRKTSLGLQVRAVSQNRAMARAMGVRSEWVDAMTFGLGSGIAGVAGVALSQLTNVGPNLGQSYIIDSFMVVVFGGVGNLWGTLVGGLGLGVANKFLEPWSGAVLAKILILVLIILFIQKRPRGLFPQKGRAAEG